MHGVLNIDKPAGITSHDVVARIRRAYKMKRVGHAGTLDPGATGVLLICLGQATRISEYLMDGQKEYVAELVFGVETTTEDFEGEVTSVRKCSSLTAEDVEAVLPSFTGRIKQVPPMVSAVHYNGKRLYELARKNIVVEREPREVDIHSLSMLGFTPGDHPVARLDVTCSKGTYIRTLCADIGRALGCGGHMKSLVRTRVGNFRLEDSVSLEEAENLAREGCGGDRLISMDRALVEMPSIILDFKDSQLIRNGVKVPTSVKIDTDVPIRVMGPNGELIAIGRIVEQEDDLWVQPQKVFLLDKDVTDTYGQM